ncbi:GspH/FimT family pseudopilin [Acidobacteria bacterium AH-259-O06]|nr:GspH/FimT family pseudopilin [Acidobacteria bacterium AH-259-O06]
MDNARGYNLLEVILVCGLVGSVSTIGLSSLQGMGEQQRLHVAAESLLSTVTGARFQAVSKNLAIQVLVHADHRKFAVVVKNEEAAIWQSLPRGVTFSRVPRKPPTFYSRGFASPGGTFTLTNRCGRIRVIISLSGRVRWERID